MILNVLQRFKDLEKKMELIEEGLQPVNREDVINHLSKHTTMDKKTIDNTANEMMQFSAQSNQNITREDLENLTSSTPKYNDVRFWEFFAKKYTFFVLKKL